VGLQLDELRQVATQRGWKIVDTYIDEGISGSVESRPALDRLMADARSGKVDLVAVWRFDRFARSTQHLIGALDEFRSLNVAFFSLREQIDTTTPMGKAMFTIVAAISELEKSIIVERVRAGVERAQAAGKHCGRPVVNFDIRPVLALFKEGHGLKSISRMLGVDRATLRRRLTEAGEWPRKKRVQ